MVKKLRHVEAKLMRGLLDLVILQFLKASPMHGYQVITKIRKNFGVYFGPSTIYPLLNALEEKGFIKSHWDLGNERPRKIYDLTRDGEDLLSYTEASLNHICRKLATLGLDKIVINGSLSNSLTTMRATEKH